jgi:hypothetical protein
MNHRPLLASPVTIARRRRLMAAITVVATLVMAVTVLFAPAADAASTQPGDFNSVVGPPNLYYIWVDDCYVDFGWVFDNRTPQTYRHIAGVRVNCSSRHSVTDATVAMYYSNGSSWVQYGNGTRVVKYNTAGSGTGIEGIVQSPAYCVGTFRAYSWIVGVTVRTERSWRTAYTQQAAKDTVGGC